MEQVLSVWSGLGARQRMIAFLAATAMFAALITLSRVATNPAMSLLYAGLDPSASGEVVSALEQRGVRFDVRGDSIFVDMSKRDELRMTLAGEGLPANGSAGYELLDSLSGFGTTSQMFDATYWRAKEGELARTILASPQIRSARVHISDSNTRPFSRDNRRTASVTLTPAIGGITPTHARSLKFLVASAVAGLNPDDVSVIDGQNGQIIGGGESEQPGDDRAETLKAAVERILEARVGVGNAVVEVSVETVTDSESIIERRIDPDSRIAISTETEELSGSAEDTGRGAVTVASNLPDGDGAGEGRSSNSRNLETRERVNYEISETQREFVRAAGAIKRLSVAVLVNGIASADGSEIEARGEEELSALRELVASAVGFDEDRGDSITIKSMSLLAPAPLGTAAEAGFISTLNINPMSVFQIVVLALVTLILGLFVVRPVLSSTGPGPIAELPPPGGDGAQGYAIGQAQVEGSPQLLKGDVSNPLVPGGMAVVSDYDLDIDALGDPVERLRDMIEERQEETVEILRSWMNTPGKES